MSSSGRNQFFSGLLEKRPAVSVGAALELDSNSRISGGAQPPRLEVLGRAAHRERFFSPHFPFSLSPSLHTEVCRRNRYVQFTFFLEEAWEHGYTFFACTVGNEPRAGLSGNHTVRCCNVVTRLIKRNPSAGWPRLVENFHSRLALPHFSLSSRV